MLYQYESWATVLLKLFLLLLRGVYSSREQLPYNVELKEFLSSDSNPDIHNIMSILREIIQKHQQQKENIQWTGDDNGEDLSEFQQPIRFLPIPIMRGTKRGTYMGPCHFKVCNMG